MKICVSKSNFHGIALSKYLMSDPLPSSKNHGGCHDSFETPSQNGSEK